MSNPIMISKAELCIILNIKKDTLRRWLNVVYYEELKHSGYIKYNHFLYRHQLDVIFPKGIDFEINNNKQQYEKNINNRKK